MERRGVKSRTGLVSDSVVRSRESTFRGAALIRPSTVVPGLAFTLALSVLPSNSQAQQCTVRVVEGSLPRPDTEGAVFHELSESNGRLRLTMRLPVVNAPPTVHAEVSMDDTAVRHVLDVVDSSLDRSLPTGKRLQERRASLELALITVQMEAVDQAGTLNVNQETSFGCRLTPRAGTFSIPGSKVAPPTVRPNKIREDRERREEERQEIRTLSARYLEAKSGLNELVKRAGNAGIDPSRVENARKMLKHTPDARDVNSIKAGLDKLATATAGLRTLVDSAEQRVTSKIEPAKRAARELRQRATSLYSSKKLSRAKAIAANSLADRLEKEARKRNPSTNLLTYLDDAQETNDDLKKVLAAHKRVEELRKLAKTDGINPETVKTARERADALEQLARNGDVDRDEFARADMNARASTRRLKALAAAPRPRPSPLPPVASGQPVNGAKTDPDPPPAKAKAPVLTAPDVRPPTVEPPVKVKKVMLLPTTRGSGDSRSDPLIIQVPIPVDEF